MRDQAHAVVALDSPMPTAGATVVSAGAASSPVQSLDLLEGADQIAEFIYGSSKHKRKVYHLAETSRLPVFRLGASLCARRSTLLRWIEEQEARAVAGAKD